MVFPFLRVPAESVCLLRRKRVTTAFVTLGLTGKFLFCASTGVALHVPVEMIASNYRVRLNVVAVVSCSSAGRGCFGGEGERGIRGMETESIKLVRS